MFTLPQTLTKQGHGHKRRKHPVQPRFVTLGSECQSDLAAFHQCFSVTSLPAKSVIGGKRVSNFTESHLDSTLVLRDSNLLASRGQLNI